MKEDYLNRPTKGVTCLDIDIKDTEILNRLLNSNKLTDRQKVALQRLLSAHYNSF